MILMSVITFNSAWIYAPTPPPPSPVPSTQNATEVAESLYEHTTGSN